ncbi:MAG: DUF2069 domain-containing protein [Pseudomonadota bacterium]|jgi:uncharacterized membrane protein
MNSAARLYNSLAIAALLGLIALSLAWELWLAPLRPGGSWLVLKALPLLAPLMGLLKGRRYTHQWTTLLALLYFAEGVVRATSDQGASQALAAAETLLALQLFLAAALFSRRTRPRQQT